MGDHGDPITISELNRVRCVNVGIGEHVNELLNKYCVRRPSAKVQIDQYTVAFFSIAKIAKIFKIKRDISIKFVLIIIKY